MMARQSGLEEDRFSPGRTLVAAPFSVCLFEEICNPDRNVLGDLGDAGRRLRRQD